MHSEVFRETEKQFRVAKTVIHKVTPRPRSHRLVTSRNRTVYQCGGGRVFPHLLLALGNDQNSVIPSVGQSSQIGYLSKVWSSQKITTRVVKKLLLE